MFAEVNKFVGGINNHLADHLVPDSQATDMLDCNVARGVIYPEKEDVSASPTVDGFAQYQVGDGDASIVKWSGEYYWSDNRDGSLNSTLGYVGIEAPSNPPSCSPATRGNRFIGKYQYLCTFETDDGFESSPFQPGADVRTATIETERVVQTLIPATDLEPFSTSHYKYRKRRGYEAGERCLFQGRAWECIQSFAGEVRQGPGQTSSNTPRYRAIADWQRPGFDNGVYWLDVTDVEITVEGYDSLLLSNFPKPTTPNVKYVNLYRTVANGGEFFLVDQLSIGSGTYRDALSDSELIAGNLLDLGNTRQPPVYKSINGEMVLVGGKYLTEVNGIFYLAVDQRVYISDQNNPHGWEPLNYREFDNDVTGIAQLKDGVLVFTANNTYRLSGSTLQDSVQTQLPVQQGCPNYKTISYFRNRPVWQSYDGVCSYSPYTDREGEFVEIVTENKYNFEKQASWSFVVEDVYYLVFNDDGFAVFIDFKTGSIGRRTLDAKFSWYDRNNDKLYLSDGNAYWLFDGGNDREWSYTTNAIVGDSLNTLKDFRRIWLDNDETVVVKTVIDDVDTSSITVQNDRKPVYFKKGTIGKKLKLVLSSNGILRAIRIEANKVR